MAMTTNWARFWIWKHADAEAIELGVDGIKASLWKSSYTPNKDHKYADDLVSASNELDGTGYTRGYGGAGRKTMTPTGPTRDDTNDLVKVTATQQTWPTVSAGTIRYNVGIKEVTVETDSPIVFIQDINASAGITTDGNDFHIIYHADGFMNSKSP